jgi:hypothetical protein
MLFDYFIKLLTKNFIKFVSNVKKLVLNPFPKAIKNGVWLEPQKWTVFVNFGDFFYKLL